MSARIQYEWVIETVDEFGDIQDVNHSDTFPGFPRQGLDIGLVRDVIDETGVIDRAWAYINQGSLPTHFNDGRNITHAVPKRYLEEVQRASAKGPRLVVFNRHINA